MITINAEFEEKMLDIETSNGIRMITKTMRGSLNVNVKKASYNEEEGILYLHIRGHKKPLEMLVNSFKTDYGPV